MALKYDYYVVDVPSDFEDEEERANLAIQLAEELTRIYAVPCDWTIISDDGNYVKVRRRRNK